MTIPATPITVRIPADLLHDHEQYVSTNLQFEVVGLRSRFAFSFKPEGRPGRRTYGAEPTTDRFGWMNPLPIVIDAHPGLGCKFPLISVHVGDVLEVEGHGIFLINGPTRRDNDRPSIETLA